MYVMTSRDVTPNNNSTHAPTKLSKRKIELTYNMSEIDMISSKLTGLWAKLVLLCRRKLIVNSDSAALLTVHIRLVATRNLHLILVATPPAATGYVATRLVQRMYKLADISVKHRVRCLADETKCGLKKN